MKDEEFHERFIVFSCQRPEGPEPRMWIAVVASCIDDPTNGVGWVAPLGFQDSKVDLDRDAIAKRR